MGARRPPPARVPLPLIPPATDVRLRKGVALGGIAALVHCYALGRIGRFGPRATAALVTAGLYATLPAVNEVPADFPAAPIWEFRLASLTIQSALGATFGLVFGFLAERALVPASARKEAVLPMN